MPRKPDPIITLKETRSLLAEAADKLMDLEEVHFGKLSFVACEKALNDALGHHGDVSWNDMLKEVGTLRRATHA